MKYLTTAVLSALALASGSYAQTFTSCNPLNTTCPPDTALGVANYTIDFTQEVMSSRVWNSTAGTINYGTDGAEFTITAAGQSPTVQTNFKLFFGQVEVWMKAATGTGIVSSIVLESDDLDEVDWEFIGGNNSFVETNYFGKGNTTSYDRAIWYPIEDVQGSWHNYTLDWSAEKLDWYVDGQIIRTLLYADANGGNNFPQTPCDVRLGIWAGGDPSEPEGVREWAGGNTTYTNAPYTMTVRSVRVSDASRATQYIWQGNSGSWQSIELSNATAALKLDGANSDSASQSAEQRWRSMSKGAKIAIAAAVGGVLVIAAAVFAFCCIKQRRAGKHERLLEDAVFDKNQAEVMAYRAQASRELSEKRAMMQAQRMGNAGATFSPVYGGKPDYPQSVRSMSTMGSQRGYQRY